ncbi:ADP-forming succinate--CoA ligase subunit beta [Candidatus Synchoanobacter obligatus]|uniref:Succinate--CoA ligase [ADP-forming] subunit beta n=1 Tax=Candidatus Synchoanobacter obligatus TaxID=2919597 RepID=A0ABT1L3U7_9GAMM|nr:ADP-forming succinate--CoA ligase subunit beta [Candidatus Synchoanobacter obligatus]MCP8351865.1 ADP-forming succinate--CoA ligase subunit beta [Candidatus Synchoanobacter obligatus]
MDLHEYQSKGLLKQYGVAVPEGIAISRIDEAIPAYKALGGQGVVVKAQVLTGGRGKAGGVKLVDNQASFESAIKALLGTRLVTYQTTSEGLPVNQLLIESLTDIDQELYLAFLVDRGSKSIKLMASTEGGVDIESVAEKTPERIHYITITHGTLEGFQARELGFAMGFAPAMIRPFCTLLNKLFQAFISSDMTMLEINPLVIDREGHFICLDAKVNLDDNALFRHKELAELRDYSQEDEKEVTAAKFDLSYIALEGEIGCMVNGAGLAMATMDMIKVCGASPANFLDVGGTATEERVTEAFKLIGSDDNVKVIFVNIFGGIVRCDLIAEGILNAIDLLGLDKPLVVRLVGNKAEAGNTLLSNSEFDIVAISDFKQAAEKAVKLMRRK